MFDRFPGAPCAAVSSVCLAAALTGCGWTAPPHDDGEEAFATQAIRIVLGRQPRGMAEVRVLADIAAASGREAMLDALFQEPDYVEYWSNVLADDLQVQREDAMRVHADCVTDALLPASLSHALTTHLATGDPVDPFCVWIRPVPRVPFELELVFDKAIQTSLEDYKGPLLDELKPPEILKEVPPWEPIEAKEWPYEPSKTMDDLAGAGHQASNLMLGTAFPSKLEAVPDWKRWDELHTLFEYKECLPFNLTDVLEASVRADRLDALYRAYLPVMATFPSGSSDSSARRELGGLFLDVYLDRDPTCMTCHTATFSRTDPRPLNRNWDRFYPLWTGLPLPLDMEGTVFSYDQGGSFVYGGDGGDTVRDQVGNFFRTDNHSGTLQPWGIDETCVTNDMLGFGGYSASLGADPLGGTATFAGVTPTDRAGVLTLVDELGNGMSSLDTMSLDPIDWAGYRAAQGATNNGNPGCTGCHGSGGGRAPDLASRTAIMSDARLFDIIRRGSGEMPAMASTDADAWDAVAWVRDTYGQWPALEMQDRNHAFAYFVAATVANHVMDETMGEPLTLAHGFPRNPKQANALADLTSTVADRFSLQDVLKEIVLSDAFNRAEPAEPTTEPYILPMVPYPQAAIHPTATPTLGDNANSEGDFVHRHSPSGLLQQVHEALGWPRPRVGADDVVYPTRSLMDGIGRYLSTGRTEDPQFALASFVQWENEVATCRKPEAVYSHHVHTKLEDVEPGLIVAPDEWLDWVDLLIEDGAVQGLTWEDLALAVKDRLVTEPSLTDPERELIESLWQESLADVPPYNASTDDKVRDYCGVLLASPDFVLRGVRLAKDGLEGPAEPTCLPGELCDGASLEEHYAKAVDQAGSGKD